MNAKEWLIYKRNEAKWHGLTEDERIEAAFAFAAAQEREWCARTWDEEARRAEQDHEPSEAVAYYREQAAAIRARGHSDEQAQG